MLTKIILRVMLLLLNISYVRIEIWKRSNGSGKTCLRDIHKFVLEILARPERVIGFVDTYVNHVVNKFTLKINWYISIQHIMDTH